MDDHADLFYAFNQELTWVWKVLFALWNQV